MKIKTAKWCGGGFVLIGLVSVIMAVSNEQEAMLAWWSASLLLLPGLLLALRSNFVTLKVICLIACFTQFVTVPMFFLTRDDFSWGHVKPFGFTAIEVWPIFLKVGAFLVLLALCFHFLSRLPFFSVRNHKTGMVAQHIQAGQFTDELQKPSRHPWIYVVLIVLVIAAVTPLNLWMFQQGISIVGIEPPRLPYKLSGILHYFTKYLVPLSLGYLYYKTRHGLFPALLLLGYGLVLGLSSVSRSSLVFVLLPVLAIAWLERKRLVLFVTGAVLVIAFSLVSQARNFVYLVTVDKSAKGTDSGIFEILSNVLGDIEWMDFPLFFRIFTGILDRIEGFGNLVMSHYYDPNAVSGAFGYILNMIWYPLAPIDIDLHHIQWQGNVLPEGFVNGGALLSRIVIVSNDNLIWIVAAALVVAVILLTLERSVQRLAMKYEWPTAIDFFFISFMTINFFISSGSVVFVFPFLAAMVFSWLPRVPIKRFVSTRLKRSASTASRA